MPFPSPGDLPDPGIEPGSPTLQADALPSEPPRKPGVSSIRVGQSLMGFPASSDSKDFACGAGDKG